MRAKRYLYRFTEPSAGDDNSWWTRIDRGMYLTAACRGDDDDVTCSHLNCVALCSYMHSEMPGEFCNENTPSSCRIVGGVFRHSDPASILFEMDDHVNLDITDNVLLSHFINEVPGSYLNALENIYTGDGEGGRGDMFSDSRLIQLLIRLYDACKIIEPHERHPVCVKLL